MATTSVIGAAAASGTGTTTTTTGKKNLDTTDFMKLLITQLQNQDPTQPMKNEELLQQVTQIGTLQSQNSLQDTMKKLVLQNQIGSAANLIGKAVAGANGTGEQVTGLVTSISVQDDQVNLELDNGQALPLNNVKAVATLDGATAGV